MGWRVLLTLLALGGAGLAGGCGPGVATVSGEVTVGGRPLEKGVISFVAAEGRAAPATANIENGKYSVTTVPGNKRVQISAPVVVGKRPEHIGKDAPLVEITEESLPERYNSQTDLTFEVKAGANTKDWAVERKKGRS